MLMHLNLSLDTVKNSIFLLLSLLFFVRNKIYISMFLNSAWIAKMSAFDYQPLPHSTSIWLPSILTKSLITFNVWFCCLIEPKYSIKLIVLFHLPLGQYGYNATIPVEKLCLCINHGAIFTPLFNNKSYFIKETAQWLNLVNSGQKHETPPNKVPCSIVWKYIPNLWVVIAIIPRYSCSSITSFVLCSIGSIKHFQD